MVKRKNMPLTDFIVIGIILLLTGYMFFRSKAQGAFVDPNSILSPEAVNQIISDQIKGTPLDDSFVANTFSGKVKISYYQTMNLLSQKKIFNSLLHFINKNQGLVEDCSACSTEASCGDSTQPVIAYPLDLTIQALHVKMQQYPKLMIIDVRKTEEYVSGHIPSSLNIPMLDLVDQTFTVDRWTEIVVVGDTYFQTKLAGESLLRLNFHRLHRLMVPVKSWDKKLESFL
jgi:rhodanese-related sulfurtransferase